jgi:hypothetical protein
MATQRRQATRQPSQTPTGWHVLVSFAVSFSYVRRRSAHTTQNRQPRSRTLLTYDGLSPADLESMLRIPLASPKAARRPGWWVTMSEQQTGEWIPDDDQVEAEVRWAVRAGNAEDELRGARARQDWQGISP